VLAENVPGAQVTLAVASASDLPTSELPFRLVQYTRRSLLSLVRDNDILICNRFPLYVMPLTYDKRVVLDQYTPAFTEWTAVSKVIVRDGERNAFLELNRRNLLLQLTVADFVLCATTRQRDLYFGMLTSMGRITPDLYDSDRELTNLFGIVPFGVRPGEPKSTKPALRGVRPGIGDDDTLLLWNGTNTEWYDVDLVIRAVHRLGLERQDVKLFFLGTEHPDSSDPRKLHGLGAGTTRAALRLCEELGVLDKSVFFNFDWVDYDHTADYLLEADIGICTYFDSLETRFAFRSRFPDLFWAELPIICTEGDAVAELVAARHLGITVPERDETALVDAIRRLADDDAFSKTCKLNLRRAKEEYRWEKTLEPLVQYCQQPPDVSPGKRERLFPMASGLAALAPPLLRRTVYRRRGAVI
jgi:glycosyltransferase involved in cell wall biosynthesis